MPATSDLSSVLDQQLLLQFGGRLKQARVKQRLTTTQTAERAGISRMTLRAVETGEPTPTMGSYLRVMGALGVSKDLALVASEARQASVQRDTPTRSSGGLTVAAVDSQHELQDLQSLMLHQEAVHLMRKQPELIQQALNTLERWRLAGNSSSRFLWDEWSVIVHRRAWRRALSQTRRSKELRQASPLATVLPPETRQRILLEVQRLKRDVPPGSVATLSPSGSAEGVQHGT
ncbi:MAG: helix-turn-helix domain-containing protein [Rhodoferax sp.]|nr:helix-turn-helix domain-containing protein [Rhodoferax sp.]